MIKLRTLFEYLSAFILGVAIACSVNPAVADITQQVARYMADTVTFRADTSTLTFPRVLAVKALTADGSDNGNITITGGGNTGSTGRGAYIAINGNESGNGAISLVEGSNSGGIALTAASVTLSGQLNMSAASTTIRQTVATGLTATGTVLADSLALTSIFNRLTTVAAGTGANLLGSTGVFHCVQNLGANNLKLYPNGASGQINGAAAGTPITLASATRDIACCVLIASNTYMCSVSPGPAS